MQTYKPNYSELAAQRVELPGGPVYVFEARGQAHCVAAEVFELLYGVHRPELETDPDVDRELRAAVVRLREPAQAEPEPELLETVALPPAVDIARAERNTRAAIERLSAPPPVKTAAPPRPPHNPDMMGGFPRGEAKPALVKLLQERGPLDIHGICKGLYPGQNTERAMMSARMLIKRCEERGLLARDTSGPRTKWGAKS